VTVALSPVADQADGLTLVINSSPREIVSVLLLSGFFSFPLVHFVVSVFFVMYFIAVVSVFRISLRLASSVRTLRFSDVRLWACDPE